MIVRAWRARADAAGAKAYAAHFRDRLAPSLRRIDGFLGATLLVGAAGEAVEILVLTRWTSLEAVAGFAGEATDRAVVEREAQAVLSGWDQTVRHYQHVEDFEPAGWRPLPQQL